MSEKAHTCMTCKVSFAEGDLQRDHYKTDWHRYNLKRKVAEMAPVTLEVFRQKMSTHEEQMKVCQCFHFYHHALVYLSLLSFARCSPER